MTWKDNLLIRIKMAWLAFREPKLFIHALNCYWNLIDETHESRQEFVKALEILSAG